MSSLQRKDSRCHKRPLLLWREALELAFGQSCFSSAIEGPTGNKGKRALRPCVASPLSGIVAGEAHFHIGRASHIEGIVRTARHVDEVALFLIFGESFHRSSSRLVLACVLSTVHQGGDLWRVKSGFR